MPMNDYIIRDDAGYSCSHPQVEKIWAWGGGDMRVNSPVYHYVTLMMRDGKRFDFGPNELSIDTDIQVNNFLNTIPE